MLNRAAETVGSKPDRVLLTHPAHWSPGRREAFTEAIRAAGVPEFQTITDPEAVAAHYAATGHIAEGDTVAVYDLGGSSFDATVLRRTADGIALLGSPEGIERLGGGTFDEAILSHVNQSVDGPLSGLDRHDPEHTAAVARLRRECRLAKEKLSVEPTASIPVRLPNRQADVALTRAEFEQLIRTEIETTVGSLLKALQSAQVEPSELAAVLLVGGSARIPLVRKMITDALARPTVLDPDPEHPVALGAAMLAAGPTAATRHADSGAGSNTGPLAEPDSTPAVDPPAPAPATATATATAEPIAPAPRRPAPEPTYSLFEPVRPVGGRTSGDPRPTTDPAPGLAGSALFAAGVSAAGATTVARPATAAEWSSAPSFLAADTAVIPTQQAAPRPTDRPTELDQPPSDSGPPPAHPVGAAGRPRRGPLAILLAVALVALLSGVGYLVWNRLPGPPAGPAAAPTAPPLAAGPPAASVAAPEVGATVSVGETPGFVVVSPDGRRALIANQAAGVVTAVDTATNEVAARIPVPTGPPQYLAFSPDGQRVYISIWDQARTVAAVGVLDTATNTIVATIPVRTRPYLSAVTPDGQRLYVPNHDSGTVSVIDTGTNTVISEIKVAPNPHWIEMSADGTRAYAANHESNLVSVIDTTDNSILAEVPVQTSPHSLAVRPNQRLVANVNYDAASVTVIDTDTDRVVATIPVGTNPQDITWAPDGRHAYVVNSTDDTVSVIDGDTATVTATVATGGGPTSVAVLPDGSAAYVSNLRDGTLSVLDIAG